MKPKAFAIPDQPDKDPVHMYKMYADKRPAEWTQMIAHSALPRVTAPITAGSGRHQWVSTRFMASWPRWRAMLESPHTGTLKKFNKIFFVIYMLDNEISLTCICSLDYFSFMVNFHYLQPVTIKIHHFCRSQMDIKHYKYFIGNVIPPF